MGHNFNKNEQLTEHLQNNVKTFNLASPKQFFGVTITRQMEKGEMFLNQEEYIEQSKTKFLVLIMLIHIFKPF